MNIKNDTKNIFTNYMTPSNNKIKSNSIYNSFNNILYLPLNNNKNNLTNIYNNNNFLFFFLFEQFLVDFDKLIYCYF